MMVLRFLDQFERNPEVFKAIDFTQEFARLDGRTVEAEKFNSGVASAVAKAWAPAASDKAHALHKPPPSGGAAAPTVRKRAPRRGTGQKSAPPIAP
jgi:hypothetical protein